MAYKSEKRSKSGLTTKCCQGVTKQRNTIKVGFVSLAGNSAGWLAGTSRGPTRVRHLHRHSREALAAERRSPQGARTTHRHSGDAATRRGIFFAR